MASGISVSDLLLNDPVPTTTVRQSLTGPHLDAFTRLVSNLISTEIAVETYAQLIDGLPIVSVLLDDAVSPSLSSKHPIYQHQELCPGVLERTLEFRDSFDPGLLTIKAALLADFRASSPGSRLFNTCLVELAAVSVHEIAVQLFKSGPMFHTDNDIISWKPPHDDDSKLFWEDFPNGDIGPTFFHHEWYKDHDQYPQGVADMVGYWAENRIFGGVVLFDRRDPSRFEDAKPDAVWFHPCRPGVTYRLVQLLGDQTQALLKSLLAETPDASLLPILCGDDNTTREDPEEPIVEIGIYRDIWERKPWPDDADVYDSRRRDVFDELDWRSWADLERSQQRAHYRHHRIWYSDRPYKD